MSGPLSPVCGGEGQGEGDERDKYVESLVPKLQLGNAQPRSSGSHPTRRRFERSEKEEAELPRRAFPSWSLGTRLKCGQFDVGL